MAELIEVHTQDTLRGLLAEITRRMDRSPDGPVFVWVPRGAALLRQMEDYQALKEELRRGSSRLKILSPDARIVGMALVFGLEAEIAGQPPSEDGPTAATAARPPTPARGGQSGAPEPAAPAPGARRRGQTDVLKPLPPPAPAPGRPEEPSPPVAPPPPAAPAGYPQDPWPPPASAGSGASEADWLLSDGVDLPAILAEDDLARSRSTTPPPDVLAGMAPVAGSPDQPAILPPVAPDQDTMDLPEIDPAFLPFAPEPSPAEALVPAPPADSMASFLGGDGDDTPAVSFSQWLAMQARGSASAPPDLDLSHLPAWLREHLAAQPPAAPPSAPPAPRKPFQPPASAHGTIPPAAPAPASAPATARASAPKPPAARAPAEAAPAPAPRTPGRSKALRCPHCGEELDKEEMLRLLAEVWGL